MKIKIGCSYGGKEIVIVRLSEEMKGAQEIARKLQRVLAFENAVRKSNGNRLIAYSIETAGGLCERYPEVAEGGFDGRKLETEEDTFFMTDRGRYHIG